MHSAETECLLCKGKAVLKHGEYPGYQEPLIFGIYHCSQCNTAFSLPRVDSSAIYENIYGNGEKVPGYSRYWKYARIIKNVPDPLDYLAESHEDYWSVREALTMFVDDKKTNKILEIGSGLGYLTYSLNTAGYDATGMDISKTAVDQANRNFGNHYICRDLFEYSEQSPASYEIVILTEVIEHVDDPVGFVRAIIKLLKPGGKAIISTPNKSLFPGDVIWASDLPPVHIWWLSEDSMKFIAGKVNASLKILSFSKYYKRHYQMFSLKKLLKNGLPRPFFNQNGDLIREIRSRSGFKSGFQYMIIRSKVLSDTLFAVKRFFKNIYGKLRGAFSSGVIVCGERGQILCTVFIKPLAD